jgi:hypothetical protein
MNSEDYSQELLNACLASVARSRWLMILGLGLAGALVLHYYSERFDVSTEELAYLGATAQGRKLRIEALERELWSDSDQSTLRRTLEGVDSRSMELAALRRQEAHYRSLASNRESPEASSLPFIGAVTKVPRASYRPLLIVMITVFGLGLWASFRNAEVCVLASENSIGREEFARLVRIKLNLAELPGHHRGNALASAILVAGLSCPTLVSVAVFVFETYQGFYTLTIARLSIRAIAVLFFGNTIITALCIGILILLTVSNLRRLGRLKQQLAGFLDSPEHNSNPGLSDRGQSPSQCNGAEQTEEPDLQTMSVLEAEQNL